MADEREKDIFGRRAPVYGGGFSADAAIVTFGGNTLYLGDVQGVLAGGDVAGSGVGLLTQQLNFSYQQNVTRVYEVGTVYTFFVSGRASGNASAARILGPRPIIFAFYQAYGNPCNADANTLLFTCRQGCSTPDVFSTEDAGQAGLTFDGVLLKSILLQSIGMSVQAENMLINENISMMFVSLVQADI